MGRLVMVLVDHDLHVELSKYLSVNRIYFFNLMDKKKCMKIFTTWTKDNFPLSPIQYSAEQPLVYKVIKSVENVIKNIF